MKSRYFFHHNCGDRSKIQVLRHSPSPEDCFLLHRRPPSCYVLKWWGRRELSVVSFIRVHSWSFHMWICNCFYSNCYSSMSAKHTKQGGLGRCIKTCMFFSSLDQEMAKGWKNISFSIYIVYIYEESASYLVLSTLNSPHLGILEIMVKEEKRIMIVIP